MTDKEIRLGHAKYFILQYLRSMESPELSTNSAAKQLQLSYKTFRSHLKDMEEMGIVENEFDPKTNVRKIWVKEEWTH